jgi:hypothetical protein
VKSNELHLLLGALREAEGLIQGLPSVKVGRLTRIRESDLEAFREWLSLGSLDGSERA